MKIDKLKYLFFTNKNWIRFNHTNVKPFEDIPGPKSSKIFGTILKYNKFFGGEYNVTKLHKNGFYNYYKYGPIIREEILPGQNIIWITTPEDIKTMYSCEGKFPQRRSHMSLQKFRLDRKEIYPSPGFISKTYEEWYRIRKPAQQCLSKIQNVREYEPIVNQIVDEFIERVNRKYMNKEPDGTCFLPEISRLLLEILACVIFNERLNSFSDKEWEPNSFSNKFLTSATDTNTYTLKTDNGLHLWKYFNTPNYKKLMKNAIYIESIATEFVNRHKEDTNSLNVLNKMKQISDLDTRELITFACDILLGGVDSTAFAICYLLYCFGTNMDKQEKLFNTEIKKFLPKFDSNVTKDVLNEISYIKYALKEVFRLHPISIGVGRITQMDAVFSGYFVPKDTSIVSLNQISCRLEKYFDQPNDFIPERWMKEYNHKPISPYLVLPFGHGIRSCTARRMAEQNIFIIMLKLLRNFSIEWKGDEKIDYETNLINRPANKIIVKFNKRAN